MPINRMICTVCDYEKDYITQNAKEEIPTLKCEKCGRELVRGIGKINYFNSLREGCWEKGEDGQEHYKGKGGRQVSVGKDGNPII